MEGYGDDVARYSSGFTAEECNEVKLREMMSEENQRSEIVNDQSLNMDESCHARIEYGVSKHHRKVMKRNSDQQRHQRNLHREEGVEILDEEHLQVEDIEDDKDKDAIVVQQRKRRATSQPIVSRKLDSSVTYKIGERLPLPTITTEDPAPTLEVRIPADLATTSNRLVRSSQLWGTDIYSDDSDLVAVLMHMGYYCPTSTPPPSCISEIKATLRILPPQTCYKSKLRNNIKSRAWGGATICSYRVERCQIVKSGGGILELEPCLNEVAPTLVPATTTRCESSITQQKYVMLLYNLCNEPWMQYSMSVVADRGLKKSQYTSARLKKGDVLYLETQRHRYELAYDASSSSSNGTCGKECAAELYKWSRCNIPMPMAMIRVKGFPLPANCVEVLDDGLLWEEIRWSPTSVWIRDKEFVLATVHFLSSGLISAAEDEFQKDLCKSLFKI